MKQMESMHPRFISVSPLESNVEWIKRKFLPEKKIRIFVRGQGSAGFQDRFKPVVFPSAKSIQCRKKKIGNGSSLTSNYLSAAANIVHHPAGHAEMIWISLNLADMKREGGQEIGDILFRRLDHQIRTFHFTPKFCFDCPALDISEFLKCIDDQVVGADMARIKIVVVREENDFGILFGKDFGNLVD